MDCISKKVICVDGRKDPLLVPCGKCIPCLSSKRNEWIFRLEQEFKASKQGALFVTLTFDQKHCPTELDKRPLQLWLKRVRKKMNRKIRYYAVGEYGTKTGRPHYHILLFNGDEFVARSEWKDSKNNPIGMVHIGTVTPSSIAYCTKYIIQRHDSINGKKNSFATMSRAYGIGGKYLTDEMIAWHKQDDRNFAMKYNQKVKLPRYYKEKIWPTVNLKPKKNYADNA